MSRSAEISPLPAGAGAFRRRLRNWFLEHGRDLPWRRTDDPYAILVSEFMLQQTQVATVIPYYERWLERFPDFATLARAEESDVLHAWQGLGYYSRARNLHAAARYVIDRFDARLPADPEKIAQLPGVGRYTAGAVATFAFDLPSSIVEANVARVLARLTNWQSPINSAAGQAHLWRFAAVLLPRRGAGLHNSALLDLGATVCLPRAPRCHACPVRFFCRAENPGTLPIKPKKPATLRLTEAHAFAQSGDRILLEQSRQRWRGMWILPRLVVAPAQPPLLQLDFPFTHHRITLAVFAHSAPTRPNEQERWFALPELAGVPIPSPHRRALDQLLAPVGGN